MSGIRELCGRLVWMALSFSVFFSGCGFQTMAVVRKENWKGMPEIGPVPDLHLVLIWKEDAKATAFRMGDPARLAELLTRECAGKGWGNIRSYQIVEDSADIEPWVPYWRPEVPVLWVDAGFEVKAATDGWTAALNAKARFQPLLFETSLEGRPVAARVSRSSGAAELRSEEDLFERFAYDFFSKFPRFEKMGSLLRYRVGKSAIMKQAHSLARNGDWDNAKKLWKQGACCGNVPDADLYENLSVASEMLEEWNQALGYHESAVSQRTGVLGRLLTEEMDRERGIMLSGMVALSRQYAPFKHSLNPKAKFAVLGFENGTRDPEGDDRLRGAVLRAAEKHAVPLASPPAEFLVTGRLEASGGAVQANLRVTHAESQRTVFEKSYPAAGEGGLDAAAERFIRSWPHFIIPK